MSGSSSSRMWSNGVWSGSVVFVMLPNADKGRNSFSWNLTSREIISFCCSGFQRRYRRLPMYPRRQHLTDRGSALAPLVIISSGIRWKATQPNCRRCLSEGFLPNHA